MTSAPPSTPSQPAREPDGLPRRFGKYTLLRKLAVGGMAELFLALQRSVAGFEKLIVVKRVLPHLAKDETFIQLLLSEARIAATLNHPNIAQVYDVGSVDGQYFIAMEHVHGEDLRSIVRQMKRAGQTTFPLEHAVALALGCCAGLAYAHDKKDLDGEAMNIVHRDVSPQNVIVTFSGDVKLVDFGIAKAGRHHLEDTGAGQLKGKVPYMSPEQAQGLRLDGRSDVFSLGIMLFELCTGRRLFRGQNEMETLSMIVHGEYPKPRDLNPNLPEALALIIERALQKSPDDRYPSARAMQEDLEDFVRGEKLKLSALALGAWMSQLFSEKLAEQKELLAQGRQLADIIAAQAAEDDNKQSAESTASFIRVKEGSSPTRRRAWLALVGGAALLVGAGAALVVGRGGEGTIEIESQPSGASIEIDGRTRPEHTPAILTGVPFGRVHITLRAPGREPESHDVELSREHPSARVQTELHSTQAAVSSVLHLSVHPAEAELYLDGQPIEGLTVPDLEPEVQHRIVARLPGFESRTTDVVLSPGEVLDLTLDLTRSALGPSEHDLALDLDPSDARVELDGERVTPIDGVLRVSAGEHRLRVTREGHHSADRTLDLPGGERSELHLHLDRSRSERSERRAEPEAAPAPAPVGSGLLTVDARPWCNVSIDGHAVGQTPVVNRSLSAGRHSVVCNNPELDRTRTVSVEVHAGETTRTRISLE
jgi:eukaryotic-like serine/threonine-protein kinase